MPECDGFDVFELLGNDLPPAVVCVTAYDQCALQAFEAGAFDNPHPIGRSVAPSKGSFSRIHHSTIVNLDRGRGLRLGEDGEYEVLLENGARLRLSQRYRKQVQSRLGVRGSNRA